ncbi:hypothetical protein BgiMline_025724 [Biomphalaria glabrata]|nr:hypothetical protein BgiMline_021781 [Biomphalaria glabrata]
MGKPNFLTSRPMSPSSVTKVYTGDRRSHATYHTLLLQLCQPTHTHQVTPKITLLVQLSTHTDVTPIKSHQRSHCSYNCQPTQMSHPSSHTKDHTARTTVNPHRCHTHQVTPKITLLVQLSTHTDVTPIKSHQRSHCSYNCQPTQMSHPSSHTKDHTARTTVNPHRCHTHQVTPKITLLVQLSIHTDVTPIKSHQRSHCSYNYVNPHRCQTHQVTPKITLLVQLSTHTDVTPIKSHQRSHCSYNCQPTQMSHPSSHTKDHTAHTTVNPHRCHTHQVTPKITLLVQPTQMSHPSSHTKDHTALTTVNPHRCHTHQVTPKITLLVQPTQMSHPSSHTKDHTARTTHTHPSSHTKDHTARTTHTDVTPIKSHQRSHCSYNPHRCHTHQVTPKITLLVQPTQMSHPSSHTKDHTARTTHTDVTPIKSHQRSHCSYNPHRCHTHQVTPKITLLVQPTQMSHPSSHTKDHTARTTHTDVTPIKSHQRSHCSYNPHRCHTHQVTPKITLLVQPTQMSHPSSHTKDHTARTTHTHPSSHTKDHTARTTHTDVTPIKSHQRSHCSYNPHRCHTHQVTPKITLLVQPTHTHQVTPKNMLP